MSKIKDTADKFAENVASQKHLENYNRIRFSNQAGRGEASKQYFKENMSGRGKNINQFRQNLVKSRSEVSKTVKSFNATDRKAFEAQAQNSVGEMGKALQKSESFQRAKNEFSNLAGPTVNGLNNAFNSIGSSFLTDSNPRQTKSTPVFSFENIGGRELAQTAEAEYSKIKESAREKESGGMSRGWS